MVAENANGTDCYCRIIIVWKQQHMHDNDFMWGTQHKQKYALGIGHEKNVWRADGPAKWGRSGIFLFLFCFFLFPGSKNDPKNLKISGKKKNLTFF